MMTVGQMMALLFQFHPDTLLLVKGYEDGYYTAMPPIGAYVKYVDNGYCGEYEDDLAGTQAVVISRPGR
jgi:hypothetical protein